MRTTSVLAIAAAVTLAGKVAEAQVPGINLPNASPKATVTQTVGVTNMEVSYHRPAVNKRAVWGELVPYGQVWRAGANENTTVTFSTPVRISGKELPAGTYGLHMIPTPKEWTVIFSKMAVAWGSFSYDEKEDALRATVTPKPAAGFHERLIYDFDEPTDNGVTLTMRWEKLQVPIAIEVDTPRLVRADIQNQLRGVPRFGWNGWNQAARYWLDSGGDLNEATAFVDRSIGMNQTYQNLTTKAMILEKKGDAKAAEPLRTKALQIATEADINQAGYQLLAAKKTDEAIAMFQRNVKAHPQSWNVHDSLGEAYLAKGDKKNALASYSKALSLVKDDVNKKRIEEVVARLKK